MARLEVDMTRCEGHGICALLFAEAIDLDRYGYAVVLTATLSGASEKKARRVAKACPQGALVVVDEDLSGVRARPVEFEAR